MLNYSKSLWVCVCFIVAGVLFFLVMPKDSARADSPYRNTQSWSGPGPNGTPITITFSTPGGPSGSQNYFSCISASDVITTSGVPSTWSLSGQVKIYYFGYVLIPQGTYDINQTGDLNRTVYYPPAYGWLGGTNTRVLIADLSIYVKDELGNFVTWVNNGGTLGPGQNWNVSCPNPSAPAISISKYTNGIDANDPNGIDVPRLAAGDPITWTYQMTNTGSIPVAKLYLSVTDNQPGIAPIFDHEISGNGNQVLDPGEVWQYKAIATAFDLTAPPPGVITVTNSCTSNKTKPASTAYVNIGTVTPLGGPSTSDPSSYCNPPLSVPAIGVIKYVSVDNQVTWDNADTAPGPRVIFNSNVFFKFVVNNSGNSTLTGITLTDNTYSTSSCTIPSSMVPWPGASSSFTCVIGPFKATLGQHTNTATATGNWTSGTISGTVSDQDSANYYSKLFYLWLPLITK